MTDNNPVIFWYAVPQFFAITASLLWLSIQRLYQHHDELTDATGFKKDTVRDVVNSPFSNGNRMSRILFDTIVLTILSGYIFIDHVMEASTVYAILGFATSFVTWLYCLVLAVTTSQFPLPNPTGWKLNIHLCILYTVLLISSSVNMITTLWHDLNIPFTQSVPLLLPVLFGIDLVYTTATVKNGSPFLDQDGKSVNGYNVESIFGIIYFSWVSPIVYLVYKKGDTLSDEDLPRLPATHRARNMFCIFSQHREKKLLHRIFLANRSSMLMQGLLGFVIPVLNYATPFFLNRFLIIIQEITSGHGDERSLIRGLGNIFGLAAFIVIGNILVEQLYFFGKHS